MDPSLDSLRLPTCLPTCLPTIQVEDDRTGLSVETLKRAFADNLFYIQGKIAELATLNDLYMALAYTVRDRLLYRWLSTLPIYLDPSVKVVGYLSAEFLTGRHLGQNLINLDISNKVHQMLAETGLNLNTLLEQEEEPGLGNGGLGRLAACYLDSLTTLEIPAVGYGIRYEFGIFDQEIRDGWQVEITDKWLRYGNPWEIVRPEATVDVKLGGHTEATLNEQGRYCVNWIPNYILKGIPYDTPISGYQSNLANTLRLWKAEACESFDFHQFNVGNYYGAVEEKVTSENLTKILYPNDEPIQGKQLRLQQQYFFVSCSLQDLIRAHLRIGLKLEAFHEKFALQLNDTHPAIAIPELMRLLVDEHQMDWDTAWFVTHNTFGYTNHTLLPEALEQWSVSLFRSLLPRHLEIIYEINRRFLESVQAKFPGDNSRLARVSLIGEHGGKFVRMAHLACVGSHAINGVAAIHTKLMEQTVLHDFHGLYPERFSNKTNGISPRRWLVLSNPQLTDLITSHIGDHWVKHLEELRELETFVEDAEFCQAWWQVKQSLKQDLAVYIHQRTGIQVNPETLFDIQVKRLHEYKRQHLNVLHIITLYNRLKQNPDLDIIPRTFIFGGKAAPSYYRAKLIIKLINAVGQVVNQDPEVRDRLKVVFLPDYNVSLGQQVYPAADLSEQISTAGKEASGTGNMKFSLNGALTIGTLDGANIEIREAVGAENFFLFGLTAQEISTLKSNGYCPWNYYHTNPHLKTAIDQIASGYFCPGEPHLFTPLVDELLTQDEYMLLADYQAYVNCQDRVSQAFRDQEHWTRMSILNTARIGKFSSDRAIREYAQDIWHVEPIKVELAEYVQSNVGFKVNHL